MRAVLDFLLHRRPLPAGDARRLARLPLVGRLRDRRTRRHAAAMAVGATMCGLGSFLAAHPVAWISHYAWDAFAYSVHGAGLMPLLSHVEPFWRIVAGDAEAVA